jgi:hypothetical protein
LQTKNDYFRLIIALAFGDDFVEYPFDLSAHGKPMPKAVEVSIPAVFHSEIIHHGNDIVANYIPAPWRIVQKT